MFCGLVAFDMVYDMRCGPTTTEKFGGEKKKAVRMSSVYPVSSSDFPKSGVERSCPPTPQQQDDSLTISNIEPM
jgi:hypothetical protein